MTLTSDDIYTSLLQRNYFPAQRKSYSEIPPLFTTELLTAKVSDRIAKLDQRKFNKKNKGFDYISYTSTRFNLVPRILHIPFPKAYIDLCGSIRDYWDEYLKHICNGHMSAIKPSKHDDGRVIIMDYGHSEEKEHWHVENSFAKKFGFHCDISNFFSSFYTHSIGWAAAGTQTAKQSKGNEWYDKLDKFQRLTTRNETKGVPIGPATSNIITEFILQEIDKCLEADKLFNNGVSHRRYIDDYQGYAANYEQAEDFIRRLQLKLGDFGLHLNHKKTHIYELPNASENTWINEIHSAIPTLNTSFTCTKRFLDYIVMLAKKYPDKNVIKYGLKCILKEVPEESKARNAYSKLLGYALNLAYHYPSVVLTLAVVFNRKNSDLWLTHQLKIEIILAISIKNHRFDAVVWILYLFLLYDHTIKKETAEEIIKTGDCLSILLLHQTSQHKDLVLKFVSEVIAKKIEPCYKLDQQWLLLYQLFLEEHISNPYPESDEAAYKTFKILKENKVSFIRAIDKDISK